jgi:hypothetical protein
MKPSAELIIEWLLDDEQAVPLKLWEAGVFLGTRSRIYVATFTGSDGQQVWRTTGLTDRDKAVLVAKAWESQARAQRAKFGSFGKHASKRKAIAAGPGLTQKEVAKILGMSERGVRAVERRALLKLRNHPTLRKLWDEFISGELNEDCWRLSGDEIAALFDLCITPEELIVMEKVASLVGSFQTSYCY